MSAFVLRRSILSASVLLALMLVVGSLLVVLGAPMWVPVVAAVVLAAIQYVVNPWIIQWLVPAEVIPFDGGRYDTGHVVGRIVAARCAEAGVRPVKLGIIDDGTPNAFTFGRTRSDARVWLSRGLLERLDEDELDAVVAHEIGHIKHWDFIVMTVAAVVPVVAYFVYLGARGSGRREAIPVMVGALLMYLVAQLAVLALSRARELGADHHSCEVTGDGDALCSALVKIGYGMGHASAEHKAEVERLKEEAKERGWKERRPLLKQASKLEGRGNRMRAMGTLGIADHRLSDAMVVAVERGLEPREVLGALRWETCNPWARTEELLSSHPIVVHRIAALERSGLPGAPTSWKASDIERSCEGDDLTRAKRRFPFELVVRLAGPASLVAAVVASYAEAWGALGWALVVAGASFLARALLQRPLGRHEPVDRVTSLLERLDASPMGGLPVNLRGEILGRGVPGYVLSPDLVIQDEGGFVPLLYRQPVPFARSLFGLFRADSYFGKPVEVRGWYRRGPGPFVELRDVVAADGTRSRTWWWVFALVGSTALTVAGAAVTFANLG